MPEQYDYPAPFVDQIARTVSEVLRAYEQQSGVGAARPSWDQAASAARAPLRACVLHVLDHPALAAREVYARWHAAQADADPTDQRQDRTPFDHLSPSQQMPMFLLLAVVRAALHGGVAAGVSTIDDPFVDLRAEAR